MAVGLADIDHIVRLFRKKEIVYILITIHKNKKG